MLGQPVGFGPAVSADNVSYATELDPIVVDPVPFDEWPLEPTSQNASVVNFLTRSLVYRRSWKTRHQCSFLTIRTWRRTMKDEQIAVLKDLKRGDDWDLSRCAAREIATAVTQLVGLGPFYSVTHIPCGHSRRSDCLAARIAANTAAALQLPAVNIFHYEPTSGSSHPKRNPTRPQMRVRHIPSAPLIVVDDVATSGAHMEEAILRLRELKVGVLPIAWISD